MTRMKRMGCIYWIALVCACLPAGNSALWGQSATGRIVGTITDPTGAVVPGFKVTATNVATQRKSETTSNEVGSYQILLLTVGAYQVSADMPGFQKAVSKPERLELNQALRIDMKLEIGQTTQIVEVEASAPGIETVSATLGQSVVGAQIANLPLNGRNVMDLALLQPGVLPVNTGGGAGSFSIAGARGDSVTFLLDGAVNNNLLSNTVVYNPNPDTLEEFVVLTNNYNAEYGRNAGGIDAPPMSRQESETTLARGGRPRIQSWPC